MASFVGAPCMLLDRSRLMESRETRNKAARLQLISGEAKEKSRTFFFNDRHTNNGAKTTDGKVEYNYTLVSNPGNWALKIEYS